MDEWFTVTQKITIKGISKSVFKINMWKCNLTTSDGKIHSVR